MGKSLKCSSSLNEISLSKNRLTSKSLLPLIHTLGINKEILTNLKILNLSFNKLGFTAVQAIANYLENPDSYIHELNLEGNLLGDKSIVRLSTAILKLGSISSKIKTINFAQNLIGDIGASACANLIRECNNMQVMILYWNEIKNNGAYLLIQALRRNSSFAVFDISWNNIGNDLLQEQNKEELINKLHCF